MAITRIKITNFKSLKNIELDIKDLNCFIGQNGVGKTNILNALKYFFDNLTEENMSTKYFDKTNAYNDNLEISITFDFKDIMKKTNENSAFYESVEELVNYKIAFNNKVIVVRLTQYKDGRIHWNYPYEMLSIIKKTHPAYFIDARNIELTNWQTLWDIVGDLANTYEINNIDFSYSEIFKDDEKKVFENNTRLIFNELENMGIQISKEQGRNRIISLYQLELGGIEFMYNEEKLDFFSDGTNAGNYIRLLSFLVFRIAQQKVKNPLVIIDEPEIGLHPRLIDKLVRKMVSYSEQVNFVISTHSPRIVKNMLKESGNLYKVNRFDQYTKIQNIPPLKDQRAKNIVSEKEASFYFANKLLFVEGVTELELFNSNLLKEVFPSFSKVDIVSFDSDNVILDLINPTKMNLGIPYLILIDADKVFKWKQKPKSKKYNLKFESGKVFNPIKNEDYRKKESLLYRTTNTAHQLLNAHSELISKEENLEFTFKGDLNVFCDESHTQYQKLIDLINFYTLHYNIYSVKYTIEGSLINFNTYNLFIDWLSLTSANFKENIKIVQGKVSEREMISILRSIVDGRLDNRNEYSQDQKSKDTLIKAVNSLHRSKKKKTEGWVTDFLEYVKSEIFASEPSPKHEKTFKNYFPELYDIITNIEHRPN